MSAGARIARRARAIAHDLGWWLTPRPWVAARVARRLARSDGRWLFLLGVNNSGTTLLAQLLAAHPRIASLPTEGQLLTRALPRPDAYDAVRLWTERGAVFRVPGGEALPSDPLRVRYDWSRHWRGLEGAAYLLEKSPPSCVRARWHARHFDPATFVALVRSPHAVCEGVARRTGASVVRAAAHWDRAHRALLDDLPHLPRALLVTYEALTADPAATLGRVTDFLGLAPLPEAAWRGPRDVHNAANVPRPIADLNAEGLARLTPADRDAISAIAGETMTRLGYTPPPRAADGR